MDKPWSRKFILTAGSVATLGMSGIASARQDSPEAANEAVVRRFYSEVLNSKGDINILDEVMVEDYPSQNPEDVSGRGAYKQRRTDQREFLDFQYDEWQFAVDELIATGERVFVRGTIKGTKATTPSEIVIGTFLSWMEMQNQVSAHMWYEVGSPSG